LDELEDRVERKGVLVAQGENEAVIRRGGLKLEVEGAAEALAQRQSPRSIDARAERRVNDELHATALIEETLGNDGRAGRHDAENRLARTHVGHRLFGTGLIERALARKP